MEQAHIFLSIRWRLEIPLQQSRFSLWTLLINFKSWLVLLFSQQLIMCTSRATKYFVEIILHLAVIRCHKTGLNIQKFLQSHCNCIWRQQKIISTQKNFSNSSQTILCESMAFMAKYYAKCLEKIDSFQLDEYRYWI